MNIFSTTDTSRIVPNLFSSWVVNDKTWSKWVTAWKHLTSFRRERWMVGPKEVNYWYILQNCESALLYFVAIRTNNYHTMEVSRSAVSDRATTAFRSHRFLPSLCCIAEDGIGTQIQLMQYYHESRRIRTFHKRAIFILGNYCKQ